MQKVFRWFGQHRKETVVIAILLALSITAHAWNMFGYPYYENDEATYVSRAWAFATSGQLDVYTYRYDQSPLGWMFMSIWVILTGNAQPMLVWGRVLMLLVHLVSTVLIYVLAKRFSRGSVLAAVVAVVLFSLSPLAIYFQRRVLLDNIMTMWLLTSLYLATKPNRRLKNYIWSGVAFGAAVLGKLNAVFFGPVFLYIIWKRARKQNRMHAMGYWLAFAGLVVGSFFLYALLKGELLSAPLDASGNPVHVSVADTFTLQLSRGDFAFPWQAKSSFVQNVASWALKDWLILGLGAFATAIVTVVGFFRRKKEPLVLASGLAVLCYLAFLARGKLVLDLYIVPVVPFLALAIGLLAAMVYRDWIRREWLRRAFLVSLAAMAGIAFTGVLTTKQYHADETSNQKLAINWAEHHIPKNANIAADNYIYPALAIESGYKNVTYFFNTEYDPEVRRTYGDDWRNIDYLILTHEIVKQIKTGTVPHMRDIFEHAELVADYRQGTSSFIDLKNHISTNGDWVQIYKTKNRNQIVQQDSWTHFKSKYIIDYGQVIDTNNGDVTTSADQATAMQRAVEQNDQQMFGGLWQWSKDHLRYRSTDKMLSWQWKKQPNGKYKLGDSNTVCDADQQVAYSLFKASEKWNVKSYNAEAHRLISDWWKGCVFERGGRLYIDSSADGSQDIRLLNPGYFNPSMYRYFAKKSPGQNWQKLTNDGYAFMDSLIVLYGTIPNWQILTPDNNLASAKDLVGASADSFGDDSMQLATRLVRDHSADPGDKRSLELLAKLLPDIQNQAKADNPGAKVAFLIAEQTLSPKITPKLQRYYEKNIYNAYDLDKGYWYKDASYSDQVWLAKWHQLQNDLTPAQRASLK